MNNRDYKVFKSNNYYHIYNRGNNKEPIFFDDQDCEQFIKRIKIALSLWSSAEKPLETSLRIKPLPAGCLEIICYCLMPNHFHLLVKQVGEISVNRLVAKVCTSYVKYFNFKYSRIGHLFQGVFKAKLVNNDSYLLPLSAYIHNNPSNPLSYKFSSMQEYLHQDRESICNKSLILNFFKSGETYKEYVLNRRYYKDSL